MEFEEFKKRGEKLLEILRDLNPELGFDESSIEWLDAYVERNRKVFSEDGKYGVAVSLGYLLGAVMIRSVSDVEVADGQVAGWTFDKKREEWVVDLGPHGQANPVTKCFKHICDQYESITSMLRVTRLLIEKGGWDNLESKLGDSDNEKNNKS